MDWLFGDEDKGPQGPTLVTLHVYNLGTGTDTLNGLLNAVGSGAYHTGVEVYGSEYSFGCCPEAPDETGVFAIKPKSCDAHQYRESIAMGDTMFSKAQVDKIIKDLSKEWLGGSYDILRHNCTHFSNALCIKLSVSPVPAWITSLAGVGAMIRSTVRQTPSLVEEGLKAAPALLEAAPALLAGAVDMLGGVEEQRSKTDALSGIVNVGDAVEIYSNSQRVWCTGRVTEISSSDSDVPRAVVAFRIPGSEQGAVSTKVLPINHKDLRLAFGVTQSPDGTQSPSATQPSEATQAPISHPARLSPDAEAKCGEHLPLFVEGDSVEIYSNSLQKWCRGHVEKVTAGMVSTAFLAPGAAPGDYSRKTLPVDHKDVRRAASRDGYTESLRDNRVEAGKSNPLPARSISQHNKEDSKGLVVGAWVEVYSGSAKQWCKGRITHATPMDVNVVFQLPGATIDEFVEKRVLRESKDIRITTIARS